MKIDHRISILNPKEAPYIDYIRKGLKHAEGRINAPKYQQLKVGDIIHFHSKNDAITVKVTFLHPYPSFEAMLLHEGIEKMLPQLKALEIPQDEKLVKGIKIYEAFPKSERVHQMGCVAIGVEPIE